MARFWSLPFLVPFLGADLAHASGNWSDVDGPSKGPLSCWAGASHIVCWSGVDDLWTAPMATTLTFMKASKQGLPGLPWIVSRAAVTPKGKLVAVTTNFQEQGKYVVRSLDDKTGWQVALGLPTFSQSPHLACTKSGDLLASSTEQIFASADGGATWSVRSLVSQQMLAPAPLPQSGGAVGSPSYGTNGLTSAVTGYTEAIVVMPWGEVFLGLEAGRIWHSFDEGKNWRHIDPLFFQPQRDMAGVPLYANPSLVSIGANGNSSGAGFTKDAEVLLSCDQNNLRNVYRLTTTGEVVAVDGSAVNLPHTDANKSQYLMNIGQVKTWVTLRSGDTLSQTTYWDHSNVQFNPDGRNPFEVLAWDGNKLSLASPAAGSWVPRLDVGFTPDGMRYFTGQHLVKGFKVWTPDPAENERPLVTVLESSLSVTIDSDTGFAVLTPGKSFQVADDCKPKALLARSWTGRGDGPVVFDDPFSPVAKALFTVPGEYVLTLTVSDGSASSGNSVLVHVLPAPGGNPPAIVAQPKNQSSSLGQTVQFALTASGTALRYRWRRNGVELTDGANHAGSTTATLTIKSGTAKDWDAMYDCRISNPFGRVVSHSATFGSLPQIIANPLDQTVQAGEAASFSVAAEGTQPMRWQWYSIIGNQQTELSGANTTDRDSVMPRG
jgi:hypothetical protein